MKKLIITAAIAVTGLFITAPEAEAGPRFSISFGSGGSGCSTNNYNNGGRSHSSFSSNRVYSSNNYSNGYDRGCAHRVIRTSEVGRNCRRVLSHYMPCGTPVYRNVTIVTYRTHYSNGSCRTFTRTFY